MPVENIAVLMLMPTVVLRNVFRGRQAENGWLHSQIVELSVSQKALRKTIKVGAFNE